MVTAKAFHKRNHLQKNGFWGFGVNFCFLLYDTALQLDKFFHLTRHLDKSFGRCVFIHNNAPVTNLHLVLTFCNHRRRSCSQSHQEPDWRSVQMGM